MFVAPDVRPVTLPVALTVATAPFWLVHVPPEVPLEDNEVTLPAQTVPTPDIVPAFGVGLTVTTCDAVGLPQPVDVAV